MRLGDSGALESITLVNEYHEWRWFLETDLVESSGSASWVCSHSPLLLKLQLVCVPLLQHPVLTSVYTSDGGGHVVSNPFGDAGRNRLQDAKLWVVLVFNAEVGGE